MNISGSKEAGKHVDAADTIPKSIEKGLGDTYVYWNGTGDTHLYSDNEADGHKVVIENNELSRW